MNLLSSRRRVLLGLAAASTAAAASGAGAAPDAIPENPRLIDLSGSVPALEAEYRAAEADVQKIVKAVALIWPLAPEPILTYAVGSKREVDITGTPISRSRNDFPKTVDGVWHYGTPKRFESDIEEYRARITHIMGTKSKRGLKGAKSLLAKAEKALPLSREYCAEIERIRAASGYLPAMERKKACREALRDRVQEIMTENATTMEGVVIKAEALTTWARIDRFTCTLSKTPGFEGLAWAEELAGAILTQAEARA